MARYVVLHRISHINLIAASPAGGPPVPPIAPGGPLPDATAKFVGYDPEGLFHFRLGLNDPARVTPLEAIHVCLYEDPADGSDPVIPDDPAQAIADTTAAGLHFSLDTSTNPGGADVDVDATEAPEGQDYDALLILEYADGTDQTAPDATAAAAVPAGP